MFRVWLPIIAACVFAMAGCKPQEPVRIGFLGGLSGRVADLGIDGRNGAILAVEQRNKSGGLNGRAIELLIEDDQQTFDIGRSAVNRLVTRGVEAVIGPMTSAMAIATVPMMNAAQVVMISPTVTTNQLGGIDDYFFRVVSSTRNYARTSADYHFQRAGVRRVAAAYDLRNKAYTESWLEDYRADFTRAGGSLVGTVPFSSGDETSFAELARRLMSSAPDGILIIANSVDTAMLCQHARKLNAKIPIVTAEWSGTERLIEMGGRAVEGIVIPQFMDRQSERQAYRDFKREFANRFGKEPGFAALTAFDATNIALDALAAKPPGQTLKQALLARGTFPGAQTPIVFDAFGDASRKTFLTTIRNGSFIVLE